MKKCSLLFTTSWDDGHLNDVRLAELLEKYKIGGTFFVPCRNIEKKPILSKNDLIDLCDRFEIGGHTLDHRYLAALSPKDVEYQVYEGKQRLEDLIQQKTDGFCYPGGKLNSIARNVVEKSGYLYARTTESLRLEAGRDPFAIPTTIQFYPHKKNEFISSFIKKGNKRGKLPMLIAATSSCSLLETLIRMFDRALDAGGIFHLWGHSWEIDEFDGWGALEDFMKYASDFVPVENRLDNSSAYISARSNT